MKKTAIGHVVCPVCDHADAEVKEDKNGHAFIFCPDCAAQTFTRNPHRDQALRKKMRPVTVTVTEPTAQPEPTPAALPKKQAPGEKTATATMVVPKGETVEIIDPPKPKKASWFSPVLAQGAK